MRIVNNRLVANPIEPRAAIAEYDADGRSTLRLTQGGWLFTDPSGVSQGRAAKVAS